MHSLSGSDSLGLRAFYEKTNRDEARSFEDELSISFLEEGEISKMYAHVQNKCPLCSSSVNRPIFTKIGYIHNQCDDCESIFVSPCLKQSVINEKVYGATKYPFFDVVNSPDQKLFDITRYNRAIEEIDSKGALPNLLVDFGCGAGSFMKCFLDYCDGDSNALGCDVLDNAVNSACDTGLNVVHSDCLSFIEHKSYPTDIPVLYAFWEILDHLVNPMELFRKVWDGASKDSVFIVSIRNSDSIAARALREDCNMFLGHAHLNFWSNKFVDDFLTNIGCEEIAKYQYISERQPLLSALSGKPAYSGDFTNSLDTIMPSPEEIIAARLAYKHVLIFSKC